MGGINGMGTLSAPMGTHHVAWHPNARACKNGCHLHPNRVNAEGWHGTRRGDPRGRP
jgi:hypothetical protein